MPIMNTVIQGGGSTPTGTKYITTNGTHDVAAYEYADVQVPTTAPAHYVEKTVDANGKLINSTNIINLNGVTDIGNNVLRYSYYGTSFPSNTSVDLSSLTTISGDSACQYMFNGCTGLTSVDLSSLVRITASDAFSYAFSGCTNLTNVNLSSLIQLQGASNSMAYCFQNCTSLTSINLGSLIAASYSPLSRFCSGCTSLTSVDFSHLCKLDTSYCFYEAFKNTSLQTLSFPNLAYTTTNYNSAFSDMLSGVTGCTVHFPADWQTTMSSWPNITNGMGGTNTTVLFDLPAVTTLDLSHIVNLDMQYMLDQFAISNVFPNVTSINLSSLRNVGGERACYYAFGGCPNLTSFDLSSLTTINGNNGCYGMFAVCANITSADLSSLTTVGNNGCREMFRDSTSLTSVDLSSLTSVSSGGFYNAFEDTALTTLSFPALKTANSAFGNMLQGVTGCTVHFPSNLSNQHFNCGGTNTTILYDLPATNTLTGADSITYTRNPKYDTATALAWKVGAYGTTNFTPAYYTSGTTDPAVSDTIYSDSACTTAVTTISSIA